MRACDICPEKHEGPYQVAIREIQQGGGTKDILVGKWDVCEAGMDKVMQVLGE